MVKAGALQLRQSLVFRLGYPELLKWFYDDQTDQNGLEDVNFDE